MLCSERGVAPRHGTAIVLKASPLDPAGWRLGKTQVFFRGGVFAQLDLHRRDRLAKHSVNMQRVARGWLARIMFREMLRRHRAALVLKHACRRTLLRGGHVRLHMGCVDVERVVRGHHARILFNTLHAVKRVLFPALSMAIARRDFHAVACLGHTAACFIARGLHRVHFTQTRDATVHVQRVCRRALQRKSFCLARRGVSLAALRATACVLVRRRHALVVSSGGGLAQTLASRLVRRHFTCRRTASCLVLAALRRCATIPFATRRGAGRVLGRFLRCLHARRECIAHGERQRRGAELTTYVRRTLCRRRYAVRVEEERREQQQAKAVDATLQAAAERRRQRESISEPGHPVAADVATVAVAQGVASVASVDAVRGSGEVDGVEDETTRALREEVEEQERLIAVARQQNELLKKRVELRAQAEALAEENRMLSAALGGDCGTVTTGTGQAVRMTKPSVDIATAPVWEGEGGSKVVVFDPRRRRAMTELEGLLFADREITRWKYLQEEDNVVVRRRKLPRHPMMCFRGEATIEHARPHEVLSCAWDLDAWAGRRIGVKDWRVISQITPARQMAWLQFEHVGNLAVQNRDFVVDRSFWQENLDGDELRPSYILFTYRSYSLAHLQPPCSTETPACPELEGYTRAELKASVLLLTESREVEDATVVVTLDQINLKGWIPGILSDKLMEQWPVDNIAALRSAVRGRARQLE